MNPSYYLQMSEIGKPIIDKLSIDGYLQPDCISTIYALEAAGMGWDFNLSSALKYLWRLGQKTEDYGDDLRKAITYLRWEYESNESANQVRLISSALDLAGLMLYTHESQKYISN